jgi:hypothetical protein
MNNLISMLRKKCFMSFTKSARDPRHDNDYEDQDQQIE